MDSGQAFDGRGDLDEVGAVLIAPDFEVRAGRDRKNGVLHRPDIRLWRRIEYVANEEMTLTGSVGQQGRLAAIRVFTHPSRCHHPPSFKITVYFHKITRLLFALALYLTQFDTSQPEQRLGISPLSGMC